MSNQMQLSEGDYQEWYAVAVKELGVHEQPGADNNKRVQEYFAATSLGPHTPDSVPWCSAFVNWCFNQCEIVGTDSAAARSWLAWGVPLLRPRVGCVIIFSRPLGGPASGHVGFLARVPTATAANVDVLGGNQGDRVCVAPYPTSRILGWRWPEPK